MFQSDDDNDESWYVYLTIPQAGSFYFWRPGLLTLPLSYKKCRSLQLNSKQPRIRPTQSTMRFSIVFVVAALLFTSVAATPIPCCPVASPEGIEGRSVERRQCGPPGQC
ncbi:hypothetical protein K474DRAFT_1710751 [Panus rudis PR-1116 ss-1]|nr:hypothetical protein K474DRAFT_1710751 [Panus rudis PR-1116 ss-1]